ncbi:hypothetical protein HID58_019423 [Brassica napus]|uniref:Uncharacterized protein n=1 Tax=Brassica napus TaxID=3708 RepID=A0ABQ8DCT8_BRANA|nr:hypothetical protein HID58_038926 [Brassica napus]KAH0927167.1 hypothetical protein HID58_019423 [Brassica napus]
MEALRNETQSKKHVLSPQNHQFNLFNHQLSKLSKKANSAVVLAVLEAACCTSTVEVRLSGKQRNMKHGFKLMGVDKEMGNAVKKDFETAIKHYSTAMEIDDEEIS